MRRKIFFLVMVMIFTVCIMTVKADEDFIEAGEYVIVKKETLREIYAWTKQAQEYMNQLLTENVALQAENDSLKKQLERSKKGLFIGGNVGLPLGGDAIIMYQFNKSGVYSQVGYQDGFNINIGYMRKIK
jgi:hypothetical protein